MTRASVWAALLALSPLPVLALDFSLETSYEITVREASGLAYDPKRDVLYTVSDEGGPIVILSMQGKVLGTLGSFPGDLEGIAYDSGREIFYIAEERGREIFEYHRATGEMKRWKVDLLGYNRRDNKGIEGVAVNPATQHLFVAKERDPHFVLELDAEGRRVRHFSLPQVRDISDLHFDTRTGHLLILSRGSSVVYEVTEDGRVVGSAFHFSVPNAEGLTLDRAGNLYLVTDNNGFARERLYVFHPASARGEKRMKLGRVFPSPSFCDNREQKTCGPSRLPGLLGQSLPLDVHPQLLRHLRGPDR